jgi:hypothetical protein
MRFLSRWRSFEMTELRLGWEEGKPRGARLSSLHSQKSDIVISTEKHEALAECFDGEISSKFAEIKN